jgi:hypothetical protein
VQQQIRTRRELRKGKSHRLALDGKRGQPQTQKPSKPSVKNKPRRTDFFAQTDTNRHPPIKADSMAKRKPITISKSAISTHFRRFWKTS